MERTLANVAKLTVGRVGGLAPETKEYIVYEDATPGFGVRVYPSGRRCYVFRYRARTGGALVSRMVTIADDRKLGLDEARRLARDLAGRVARGEDPSHARAEAAVKAAARRSFAEVREDFLAKHVDARLKPSTASEYRRVLIREFAALDRKPFEDVTQADIANALQTIAGRGKLRTANLARAYARKFYSWARANGLCPVNLVKETERFGSDVRRERVLSLPELGQIYLAALGAKSDFGAIVRLLMLTGQRKGEVFGMIAEEVNTEAKVWRLPASRTKNRKAHDVPLSATCVRIIAKRSSRRGLVFSTTEGSVIGNVDRSKKRLDALIATNLRRSDPAATALPHWTLHDLRRSFVTHAHGELGVPVPVLERAINHISGSFGGVVGIYNRAPLWKERVAAFEAWEGLVLAAAGLPLGHRETATTERAAA
ncbi:hypothetical protein ASF27_10730 [Methylobacterium sp. Leaf102]|uniref:tyrosine-type recombinase/integrase n=1 Tax=Methylobacterium sp. Leaf102 TaxID=1736253 RepID=UPI000700C31A|nr:site-specific integrase [Methylobacterium sp. Leaf102]KQP24566.1 hypothetical protein ASF27_10730 [Methylobacterium sp. Leaf102]